MKTKGIFSVIFITASFPLFAGNNKELIEIKPWKSVINIADVERVNFKRIIFSKKGNKLYEIQCHQGGYDDDPGYAYSGLIDCKLKSLKEHDDVDSLFRHTFHQTAHWETRGRFLLGHVNGICGNYPEWGRKRNFRVRGMKITLEIINPLFSSEKLINSYQFSIIVNNDRSAKSFISSTPKQKEPTWFYYAGLSCEDGILRASTK